MRPIVLAALLSLLSAGAYAALAWQPSGADSALADVESGAAVGRVPAPGASPPRPPVRARFHGEAYPVQGATEAEVLQSLLDAGPRVDGRSFFGLTTTETDLHYRTAEADGLCALVDVAVDLDVTVTLPDWSPPREAPPALRRNWGRFLRALRRHEDEHRTIAVVQAEALQRAVAEARGATCAEAAADGRHRAARLQIETAAAHRQLDEATGHGRAEGAVWPVAKGEG